MNLWGWPNYVNVFKDPKVQTSVVFTAIFVVVSMFFHILLGVALAMILNMKFRGRRFFEDHCPDPLGYAHSSGRHGGKVGL